MIAIVLTLSLSMSGCQSKPAEPTQEASSLPASPQEAEPEEPEAEPQSQEAPKPDVKAVSVEGACEFQHGRDGGKQPLKEGQQLNESDIVFTGKDAVVVIRLDEGKEVHIGENTVFALSAIRRGADGNVNVLALKQGSVVNIVDTKLEDNDVYEVHTPRLVMSVRGTSNYMSSGPDGDEVIGITGTSGVFSGGQSFNAVQGMGVMLPEGGEPALEPAPSDSLPPLASGFVGDRGLSYPGLSRGDIASAQSGVGSREPDGRFVGDSFSRDLFNSDDIAGIGEAAPPQPEAAPPAMQPASAPPPPPPPPPEPEPESKPQTPENTQKKQDPAPTVNTTERPLTFSERTSGSGSSSRNSGSTSTNPTPTTPAKKPEPEPTPTDPTPTDPTPADPTPTNPTPPPPPDTDVTVTVRFIDCATGNEVDKDSITLSGGDDINSSDIVDLLPTNYYLADEGFAMTKNGCNNNFPISVTGSGTTENIYVFEWENAEEIPVYLYVDDKYEDTGLSYSLDSLSYKKDGYELALSSFKSDAKLLNSLFENFGSSNKAGITCKAAGEGEDSYHKDIAPASYDGDNNFYIVFDCDYKYSAEIPVRFYRSDDDAYMGGDGYTINAARLSNEESAYAAVRPILDTLYGSSTQFDDELLLLPYDDCPDDVDEANITPITSGVWAWFAIKSNTAN